MVVLTKYDTFIDHVERTLDYSPLKGWSEDAVDKHINQTVEAERDVFIERVQKDAGSNIPYATVSSMYPCILQLFDAWLMNLRAQIKMDTRR